MKSVLWKGIINGQKVIISTTPAAEPDQVKSDYFGIENLEPYEIGKDAMTIVDMKARKEHEAKISEWLDYIEETDHSMRADWLRLCRENKEARDYSLLQHSRIPRKHSEFV